MLSKRSVFSTAIMLPFAAADAGNLDCWIKPPRPWAPTYLRSRTQLCCAGHAGQVDAPTVRSLRCREDEPHPTLWQSWTLRAERVI